MSERAKIIERLNNSMYAIISQIQYGDISDLDTRWSTVADLLADMKFREPISVERDPKKKWGPHLTPVLTALNEDEGVNLDDLIDLVKNMEELSAGSSGDPFEDEEAEELLELVPDFEDSFSTFLDEQLPALLAE
ncbi:MAG: hypothetical protein JWM32_913 [Verrucomicrobia bacterium]|nr:hypothetical protein [Verrucomicrobiota bacterium]